MHIKKQQKNSQSWDHDRIVYLTDKHYYLGKAALLNINLTLAGESQLISSELPTSSSAHYFHVYSDCLHWKVKTAVIYSGMAEITLQS